MPRMHWALVPLALALTAPVALAQSIKIVPGSVEDTRASTASFGGLSIELKLSGDGVPDVKGLRWSLKSAKDDQGTALFKPDPKAKAMDFEEFSIDRRPGPKMRLSNPARGASSVEVRGEVEIFVPKKDPNATQKIAAFQSRLDKPIANPTLKSAKVEITPLSPAGWKSRAANKKPPTKEEIIAEGKRRGASDKEIEEMVGMLGLIAALGSLGAGEEPGETSVLFEVKDSEGKVLGLDVAGSDGSELHASSRSSSGGGETKMVKIDLSEKAPADAVLVVTLRTSKSVITIPLSWKEVPLP